MQTAGQSNGSINCFGRAAEKAATRQLTGCGKEGIVGGLPIEVSFHAEDRLRKRFGLKRSSLKRHAEKIIEKHESVCLTEGGRFVFTYKGDQYVFAKTHIKAQPVFLMVTACNAHVGSELVTYIKGKKVKRSVVKTASKSSVSL